MPGELFINPLCQNQYVFVEVKTFKAGKDISQQPFALDKKDILKAMKTIKK